jgi:hypothetical protein
MVIAQVDADLMLNDENFRALRLPHSLRDLGLPTQFEHFYSPFMLK